MQSILLLRATVYGLWVTDDPYRVSSGYITKDTKVKTEFRFELLIVLS